MCAQVLGTSTSLKSKGLGEVCSWHNSVRHTNILKLLHTSVGSVSTEYDLWRAVTPPGLNPGSMGYQTCTLTAMPKCQAQP